MEELYYFGYLQKNSASTVQRKEVVWPEDKKHTTYMYSVKMCWNNLMHLSEHTAL